MKHTGEAAFEAVIEAHLLDNGYVRVASEGFDRDRAIFPGEALAFIRDTQPEEWAKLETRIIHPMICGGLHFGVFAST